ncbi:MAG: GntR family transcriptional regulator [Clostridiaceae bacterium]|nr:GntR family transcriptional regulator [Clostridiaceae bacterium]
MVAINKYSDVPLYCQLKNIIIKKIENGDFKADSKIPSEQDFCEQYNISRPTVRQAINELTASGRLYKLKGKGTFVAAQKTLIKIKDYTGFTDSILDSKNPAEKNIISIETVSSKDHEFLTEAFCLKSSSTNDFVAITFTNSKDEIISLNVSYLPLALFPDIIDDLNNNRDVLRGKYPLIPTTAKSTLDVICTEQKDAAYLNIQPGQPLICISNILYSKSAQPVEYISAKYRADKVRLQFENRK